MVNSGTLALVINRAAGDFDKDTSAKVCEAFAGSGQKFEQFENDDPVAAAEAAIARGHTRICACGGDGTVAGVANAILRSQKNGIALAIIPLGTGNIIATAIGLPSDFSKAVEVIQRNITKRVDAGKIGDRFFLLGLGTGATEKFVTQADSQSKQKIGKLAYALTLLKHMSAPLFQAQVQADSNTSSLRVQAVTLANYWGTKNIEMLEGTAPDDGVMECLLNGRLSAFALLRLCVSSFLGKVQQDQDVQLLKGSRFKIETAPSMPIQLDGNETDLATPIVVEVLHQAIEVVVDET